MTDVRTLLRWDGTLPDPASTPGAPGKAKARRQVEKLAPELVELQERLFAAGKEGSTQRVLLVLQGRDACGKDGVVKNVVGRLRPLGVRVTAFGRPTEQELAHDFLWRFDQALPQTGQVGVFNRSQYEDVLVVRVHGLVPEPVWQARYGQIAAWEQGLVDGGCAVVKVFLHVSRGEQRARLLSRLDTPSKHWKVGSADNAERALWSDYDAAYDAVLAQTSTTDAPWYVVPADHKWYRDWALAHLLTETLRELDPQWPEPAGKDLAAIRQELLDQSA